MESFDVLKLDAEKYRRKVKKIPVHGIEGVWAQIIIWVLLILDLLLVLLPLFVSITNSLKTGYEIQINPIGIPENWQWSNYAEAFSKVGVNLINSILIALICALVNNFSSTILGYIFVRKEFLLKEFIFTVYMFMMLIPGLMGMGVLFDLVFTLGLHDTWWAIIIPSLAGGQISKLFLFRTFFGQQPSSIFEAAKVDGANDVSIFFRICLPMSIPIVIYGCLGTFTGQYNAYLWPYLVISTKTKAPLMPLLRGFISTVTQDKAGITYAIYLVSSLPLIVTTIVSLKFFSSGSFAAGLKL